MTELVDRMTRLADAAVGDHRLTDPSASVAVDGRRSGRPWPWLGAVAALLALVAVAAVLVVGGDEEGPVTAGPSTTASGPSGTTAPLPDPVLSIAIDHLYGPPLGLTATVRDASGAVVAERTSAEVEEPVEARPGNVAVLSGLVVELPGAGAYRVDLDGPGYLLTCEVGSLAAGDRLVLPVTPEADPRTCGATETVDDWATDSGEVGRRYVGLTEAEAERRAAADGYDTRVTGRDGIGMVITMDIRPDRLDLKVFDGVVVSAALGGEPRVHDEPRVREPVAVVIVNSDGPLPGRGEVTVVVRREGVSREWGPDDDGMGVSVLIDDLPAGPATVDMSGQDCPTDGDVVDGGTVITIEVDPDGSPPDGGCQAHVETLDEHVARITEGWDAFDPADGYVGLTEAEARQRAEADGRTVRVLARDGRVLGRTDDLRTDRVNLILFDDEVRAAALF